MRRSTRIAMCAAIVGFASHRVGRADSPSQVVLLTPSDDDVALLHAEMRLAAELRAAGFEVVERSADGATDLRDLVDTTGSDSPFATVLLHHERGGAFTDVWVADHVTRKIVARRIVARGAGDAADRSLALRVVELMRASLVEGLILPPPDDGPPAPPAPPDVTTWTRDAVRVDPPRRETTLELALGASGVFSGPDLGLAVAPSLRVAWRAAPAWSFALLGVGPAFGARVSASEGTATVLQELGAVEAAFDPFARAGVRPYVAAGLGAYHLASTGYANMPYTSAAGDSWSALFEAGLGLRVPLSNATSLVLDARELLALPRPVVAFAGREVARAVDPGTLLAFSLSVDLQ